MTTTQAIEPAITIQGKMYVVVGSVTGSDGFAIKQLVGPMGGTYWLQVYKSGRRELLSKNMKLTIWKG